MRKSKFTDEQLKQLYRDGNDYVAFETLYYRHNSALYRFAFRQCNDMERSKEIIQDTWLKVLDGCENYIVSAKFTTWLYKIAHNKLIDYYRSHKRESLLSYDSELSEEEIKMLDNRLKPDMDELIDSEQQTERLLIAISQLPEAQRETILLHLEGFSLIEIAQITQSNLEAVKSRLRYALKKIRQRFLDE